MAHTAKDGGMEDIFGWYGRGSGKKECATKEGCGDERERENPRRKNSLN